MPLYTGSPSPSPAAAAALRSASPSCRTVTHVMFRQKYSFMVALQAQHSKYAPNLIRSVVKSIRSDTTDGDNGTTEPARELLERLFVRTQSLDSSASHDSELSLSIEVLKSEFEGALSILRKKERDIRDAEKRVSDDRVRLSQTKQDLDQREKEISKAHVRQQGIEKALKKASKNLALRVKQINNLKLLVEEQDKKIASSQSLLSQKVVEVESLKQDMFKKNEEANLLRSEIKSKEQLLLATNQAVVQQEATVRELRSEIKRKTMDITRSNELRKANEEKLNVAEQELEKQNLGWLAAQQELKELAQLASKDTDDLKGTITDFKRVRSLLDAVRAELISSKEAFASSRRQIEDQVVADSPTHLVLRYGLQLVSPRPLLPRSPPQVVLNFLVFIDSCGPLSSTSGVKCRLPPARGRRAHPTPPSPTTGPRAAPAPPAQTRGRALPLLRPSLCPHHRSEGTKPASSAGEGATKARLLPLLRRRPRRHHRSRGSGRSGQMW